MNSPNTMSELFNKLNDLKSVFKYGERLIPIVQSLVDFMRDTVPLLEKINSSIAESTNKIPKATNQINSVTSATELATTEILDLVDFISADINKIEMCLQNLQKREAEKIMLRKKIVSMISETELSSLVSRYFEISEISTEISPLINLFPKIKTDVYNITLSLQVQDITSQQLAAVNHLIESVQEKLASLIFNFQETNIKNPDLLIIDVPRDSDFNPDARYTKSEMPQQLVESIIKTRDVATQDEIDKLFVAHK